MVHRISLVNSASCNYPFWKYSITGALFSRATVLPFIFCPLPLIRVCSESDDGVVEMGEEGLKTTGNLQ